jgi:hypothetical protein
MRHNVTVILFKRENYLVAFGEAPILVKNAVFSDVTPCGY